MKYTIAYLCLQVTREGQASYSHVHEIIKGLENRGHKITLFEPKYPATKSKPSAFLRLKEFLKTNWRLINALRTQNFDLIYIRGHFAAIPTAMWARFFGIQVVQEINGPYDDLFLAWPLTKKLSRIFILITRLQLKWADAIIAVTPQLVDWAQKESNNPNVFMVSNGANINLFTSNQPQPFEPSINNPYVLFFGALAPWQGVDQMIEAVHAPEWPAQMNFVIVGDGMDTTKVKKAASVTKQIIYLGQQPQKKLPPLIAHAVATLSPKIGNWKTTGLFPLKLFESLACGTPVIVSDFPGMADFVLENNCGLIIQPNDPRAIAQAVAKYYSDPRMAQTMGARGFQIVTKEHSWDKRAEQTLKIIVELLVKSNRSCDM